MIQATLGQVLVNQALPKEYRKYDRVLVGNELDDLLKDLATKDPEKYRETSHKLVQLGSEHSFLEGTTLKLSDLVSPIDRKELYDYIDKQEDKIDSSTAMTPSERNQARTALYGEVQKLIADTTYDKALKSKNPLALQVLSKARGNPIQLSAMLSTPAMFSDNKGRTLPVFTRHSYAEGLNPAEYYSATFGARTGVKSTKFATREAGDFGKQLNVASAGLVVTEPDCGTINGIPVDVTDHDNVGSLLAKNVAGFKMGTPVTGKMLAELKRQGIKKVIVRSPIACNAKDGGVCAHCAGLREDGKLPSMRDHIGLKASSALSERIAQGALNVKHSGGQKDKGEEVYAGFPIIEQLGSIPKAFKHKATLASTDGQVSRIDEAPQGGYNVLVGEETHYVEPDRDLSVKVGDQVEAGDQLSNGLVNPAEVVKYKGLGEGRKYFTERLTKVFRDSKLKVNRRNVEVVAKAMINHVNVQEPQGLGDYLPGDTVSYSALAHSYRPRKDAEHLTPQTAVGKYLEQPVLHHTIGTRVTKRMVKELKDFGVDKVLAHPNKPGFEPEMIRLRAVPHHGDDWMGKLQGSYLQTVLLQDAQTGGTSNIHGTNPMPGLAYGVEFGQSKPDKVTF